MAKNTFKPEKGSMLIGNVENGKIVQVPIEVYNTFSNMFGGVKKGFTFKDIEDCFPQEEIFVNYYDSEEKKSARIALSVNLIINGLKVLIKRNDDIYLSKKSDIKVNLGVLDTPIASRVFLPGGDNYGILGKIASLRSKNNLYYNIKTLYFGVSHVDSNMEFAYEYNNETKEECFMLLCNLYVENDDLMKLILDDPNVQLCTAKV